MALIAESTESRRYRMRWRTLTVLSLSLLIIIIDDTIVNVSILLVYIGRYWPLRLPAPRPPCLG